MLIYKLSEGFIKSIDSSTLPEKFPGIIIAMEDNNAVGFIYFRSDYGDYIFSRSMNAEIWYSNTSLEDLLNHIKRRNKNIEFRLIEFI